MFRLVALPGNVAVSARGIAASVHMALVPLSFVLFMTGWSDLDFNVMLSGVVCIYLANVVYGFLQFRERLLFLFLHAGLALFLLSRPVIGALDPDLAWLNKTVASTEFALGALYLSMFFLFLGTAFCTAVTRHNERERERRQVQALKTITDDQRIRAVDSDGNSVVVASQPAGKENALRSFVNTVNKFSNGEKMYYIRIASLVCFLVCLCGSYCDGFIKLSYMEGLAYEQYYLISSSDHVPWAVSILKVMTPYMLCSYLASMPKKAPSVVVLVLYVATTIPMLMIGSRGDFVIAFLFAALYFAFRATFDDQEKWITKEVVAFVAIAAPVGVFFMGMWTYLRAGEISQLTGIVAVFEDAFYKQGVSYSVLGYGFDVNPLIQELGFKFYTLGALYENIMEGFIGTTFFGVVPLPSTNSTELALLGHSYSHAMSFFAHPNYLGGEGYGSSYILEWYADFGIAGIAVGSFLIASGLYLLSRSLGRSWFWGMCALISSSRVFHMPRGTAAEWFSFLLTTRFWLAVCLVVIATALIVFVIYAGKNFKTINMSKGISGACFPILETTKKTPYDFRRGSLPRCDGDAVGLLNRYELKVIHGSSRSHKR